MRKQLFTDDGQWNADGFTSLTTARPAEDLPSSADAYVIPTVENFDSEAAASSPLFGALREAAFESGMGQAAFDSAVEKYIAKEVEASESGYTTQMAELGANAQKRIDTVSDFLSRSLPPEEYQAITLAAGSAKGIAALERLMNLRGAPAPREGDPPPAATKTKAEIEAIMASDAYRGKPGKPADPAVRKEVDDWFAKNAD